MISVITPCYNHADFLNENIKSVLAQEEEHEHIIVDDGSTDHINDILRLWNKNESVRVIRHDKNRGLCAARNTAIRNSFGDFIVPLDADDMLTPDSLKVRLNMFNERKGLDVVHGYALKIKGYHTFCGACRERKEGRLVRHPSRLHAQGMMFRKSVFEKFGLYFDVYSKEDKEYLYRLGMHRKGPFKKKVAYKRVMADVAFYRRHPRSMHKLRVADKKFDREICRKFDQRIKVLKRNFVTKDNTEWL